MKFNHLPASRIHSEEVTKPENWVITFAFVGLEVFTGIILAVILKFINVEKDIAREQEEIKARRAEK